MRHHARLDVSEPIAHRHFDGLDRQPDEPGLIVHDVLDLLPAVLLRLAILRREHLIERLIDARFLRRRRLLLPDKPVVRLARRPPQFCPPKGVGGTLLWNPSSMALY